MGTPGLWINRPSTGSLPTLLVLEKSLEHGSRNHKPSNARVTVIESSRTWGFYPMTVQSTSYRATTSAALDPYASPFSEQEKIEIPPSLLTRYICSVSPDSLVIGWLIYPTAGVLQRHPVDHLDFQPSRQHSPASVHFLFLKWLHRQFRVHSFERTSITASRESLNVKDVEVH